MGVFYVCACVHAILKDGSSMEKGNFVKKDSDVSGDAS